MKLKQNGKVFQLMYVTPANTVSYLVFRTEEDAKRYVSENKEIKHYQIVDIEVLKYMK